jgi:hypothetical protein
MEPQPPHGAEADRNWENRLVSSLEVDIRDGNLPKAWADAADLLGLHDTDKTISASIDTTPVETYRGEVLSRVQNVQGDPFLQHFRLTAADDGSADNLLSRIESTQNALQAVGRSVAIRGEQNDVDQKYRSGELDGFAFIGRDLKAHLLPVRSRLGENDPAASSKFDRVRRHLTQDGYKFSSAYESPLIDKLRELAQNGNTDAERVIGMLEGKYDHAGALRTRQAAGAAATQAVADAPAKSRPAGANTATKFVRLSQAKKEHGGERGEGVEQTEYVGLPSDPGGVAAPLIGERVRNVVPFDVSQEERDRARVAAIERAEQVRERAGIQLNSTAVGDVLSAIRIEAALDSGEQLSPTGAATAGDEVAANATLPQRQPERRPTPAQRTVEQVREQYAPVLGARAVLGRVGDDGWDPTLTDRYWAKLGERGRSERSPAPAAASSQNPGERAPAASEFPVVAGFSRGSRRDDGRPALVRYFRIPNGRHGKNVGRHRM